MQKRGWHTTGIDLNEGALDVARLNGLHVTRGTLEECNFENNSFDVVHLGDLIEHVRSPRSLLKEIRRILRPGGMVVIATPNANSGFSKYSLAFSRFTGMSWAHSQAPYHLYEYRPDTLVKLLERSGFEIENLIIHGKGSFPYLVGATGYFDELKRELKREGRYNFSINLLLALPKLMLVSGILLPLWFAGRIMDNRHRSGRNIMLTARRRRGGSPG
jgi:SAM-dependent methyltransferase